MAIFVIGTLCWGGYVLYDRIQFGSLVRSAEAGNPDSAFQVGLDHFYGSHSKRDLALSMMWFRRSADAGNLTAQRTIGFLLWDGKDFQPDRVQAVDWIRRAVDGGDGQAAYALAQCIESDSGLARDSESPLQMLTVAAERGFVPAQLKLAEFLVDNQRHPEAVPWLEKAMASGSTTAMVRLARLCETVLKDERNMLRARTLYQHASELGSTYAIYRLGRMNLEGLGGSRDLRAAEALFRKAANAGDLAAQFEMGIAAENRPSSDDPVNTEAAFWFKRAAANGGAKLLFQVGKAYEEGRRMPQNFLKAHCWLNLAVVSANESEKTEFVQARDALADRIGVAQVAEAQLLAARISAVSSETALEQLRRLLKTGARRTTSTAGR